MTTDEPNEAVPVLPGDLTVTGLSNVVTMFESLAARLEADEHQTEETRYLVQWYRLAAESHRVNLAAALDWQVGEGDDAR